MTVTKDACEQQMTFVDLCSSCALVPKLLDTFLFDHRYISYNDCLTYLFFCFTFLSMQSFNLAALSYDRLVAIIFPLHYQVKVTNRFMLTLIASFWLYVIIVVLIAVGLITRISFCNSVVIDSYFCDHGPLFRLGCNDITPSFIMGRLSSIIILFPPLIFILGTYCGIVYALWKISKAKERIKAFKTCAGHLSLVAIYFLPIIFVHRFGASIHPNARIINLSLTSVVPPMLNPIIYVLQTVEIKESLKKLLKNRGPIKVATSS